MNAAQGEVVAMGVDPYTLYSYWEINQPISQDMRLTIYNRTENISWEIPISQQTGSLYVEIGDRRGEGACDFQVAIMPIAVSNIISVPPLAPSNCLDQEWCNHKEPYRKAASKEYEEIAVHDLVAEGATCPASVLSSFCLVR